MINPQNIYFFKIQICFTIPNSTSHSQGKYNFTTFNFKELAIPRDAYAITLNKKKIYMQCVRACMCVSTSTYIFVYVYVHGYMYIHIYPYVYTYRDIKIVIVYIQIRPSYPKFT